MSSLNFVWCSFILCSSVFLLVTRERGGHEWHFPPDWPMNEDALVDSFGTLSCAQLCRCTSPAVMISAPLILELSVIQVFLLACLE